MPLSKLKQYLLREQYEEAGREGERLIQIGQLCDEDLSQAYRAAATSRYYLRDIFAAIKFGERALEVASRTDNWELIGKARYDLGDFYRALGDYPQAYDLLYTFLADMDRYPTLSWLEAWTHHNLALIFRYRHQYDDALASHHLAADLHRQQGDMVRMMEALRGIIWCYLVQGQAAEALPYLNQISSYLEANPNDRLAASLLTDWAFYYQQAGDLKSSMSYCTAALNPSKPGVDDHILATACLIAAENALSLQRVEEAKIFTNLAEEYALRSKHPALMNRATGLKRKLQELGCSLL